ncbi:MAG: hypothetical protein IT323_09170 [Anaerolineae bacterium]|nr:hypothetical protein [Anaerolineae bacterium]
MSNNTPCKDAPESLWTLLGEAWQDAENRRAQAQSFSQVEALAMHEERLDRLSMMLLSLNASPALQALVKTSQ